MLDPEMSCQQVDGFVLSAAPPSGWMPPGGVQAWLRAQGRGFTIRGMVVPLVAASDHLRPRQWREQGLGVFFALSDLGYEAAQAATHGEFALGQRGRRHRGDHPPR